MFGDIGHGSLILFFGNSHLFCDFIYLALFVFKYKDKLINCGCKSFEPIIQYRYLLLFMGFFATFSGFMYNEWFAITFNLWGSCYNRVEVFFPLLLLHNSFFKIESRRSRKVDWAKNTRVHIFHGIRPNLVYFGE